MGVVEAEPLADAVSGHARRCWPGAQVDVLRWTDGGLVENLPDLRVVRVAPSAPDAPWIYVSAGASAEPMEDGYGIEVLVVTREEAPLAVKLVAMVANLHADPRYPLSMGQVLEIGQPWLPGASCDHLLVCLPDLLGPEFEWLSGPERTIRFVWLLPITAAEADLARTQGFTALQERLGAAQADVASLARKSVV